MAKVYSEHIQQGRVYEVPMSVSQLTPSELLGLPYILPLLCALIAVIGVFTSLWLRCLPKAAACCVAGSSLIALPFLFLAVGAGLFPVLLISGKKTWRIVFIHVL